MELRRLISRKNVIIIGIVLFLLNLGLFVKEQADHYDVAVKDIFKVQTIAKEYRQNSILQEDMDYTIEIDRILGTKSYEELSNRDRIKIVVLEQQCAVAGYKAQYEQRLGEIQERVQKITKLSLFSEEKSFTQMNAIKTGEDFARLQNIIVLEGNDNFLTSVMNYKTVHYFILLFVMVVVLAMMEENRSNVRLIMFASEKGRMLLTLRRMGALLALVVLYSGGMFAGLFGMSAVIYGGDSSNRMVQSIPMFQDLVIPLTIGQFLVSYFFVAVVGIFIVAMLFWLCTSLVTSKNLSLLLFGVLLVIGYVCRKGYTNNSSYVVLRYVNFFFMLDMTELFTVYINFKIGKWIVGQYTLLGIGCGVGVLGLGFGVLYYYVKKYPIRGESRLERVYHKWVLFLRTQTEKLSPFFIEIYKILILKKEIYIFIVFAFVAYQNIDTHNIYYKTETQSYNIFCDSMGNQPLNDDIKKYILQIESEGATSPNANWILLARNKAEYLEHLKETQNIEGYMMREQGYDRLLRSDSSDNHMKTAMLTIFAVILLVTGVFDYEKKQGMLPIIRSSEVGRRLVFRKKLQLVLLLTIAIFSCIYGMEFYSIYNQYGLTCFNAPVKTLAYMENTPFNMSLGIYLSLLYFLRFALCYMVALIVALLSVFASYPVCLGIGLGVFLLPSIMYFMGLKMCKSISVMNYMSAVEQLVSSKGRVGLMCVIVLFVFLGMVVFYLAKRKWCEEGQWEE